MTPSNSVLIVDDEPAVCDIMARWAASLGLTAATAASADEALETQRTRRCDLAVIDVIMPERDGFWLANAMRREHPETALVLATGYMSVLQDNRQSPPLADLLLKPFPRERFALAVDRGRQWKKETLDEIRWHESLTLEFGERIAAIRAEIDRETHAGADEIAVLAAIAQSRTRETMEHGERAARYALAVAREMNVDPTDAALVGLAARFHDIGKLAIPDSLLDKPSPLTPGERTIMCRHVEAGADILRSTKTLQAIAPLVMASHEWFGGGGYPCQLSSEAIPLASRIIAVVDAYDAMTQARPYRSALDSSEAVSELLRCARTQFDPDVIAAFLAVLGRH